MLVPTAHKHFLILVSFIVIFLFSACDFTPSASPETHIENAKKFLTENKLNASLIELKNALQLESNLPEARRLMGEIYLKYGDGAAAFNEITHAQSLGLNDPKLDTALLQAMQLKGDYQDILDKTYTTEDMPNDVLIARGNAFLGLKQYQEAESNFNKTLAMESTSVGGRVGLAHIALVNKELDKASNIIDEAYALAPDEYDVWMLKGQLAFLQGLPANAEKAFAKAASLANFNPTPQFRLIHALIIQEKTEEALATIDKVESRFPKHPITKYFRGLIAFINGDSDKSKNLLQDVIKVYPKHAESLLLLSRIHYNDGQLEQAKEYISAFLVTNPLHLPALKLLSMITVGLNQADEALRALSAAAKEAPDDGQVLALLGNAYMEGGNIEKGIELLEEATHRLPDTSDIRTQLAIGHLLTGETDIAVSELKTAIEIDPDLMRADILLILTYIRAQNFDEAIKSAQNLAAKQPNNPLPDNLIGAAHLGKGDDATARQHFEKALSIKPGFAPALANLARLDLKNNNTAAAENKYREILEIDPNNSDTLMNLAALELQYNNIDAMHSLLERARANNSTALAPRILLSKFYLENNNFEQLLEVATEAFALSPKHPEVLLLLGQAQRLSNKPEESIETLKTLIKLIPDSHSGLFELGLTQFQAGDLKVAKQTLDEILKINPEHVGALIASAEVALKENQYELAKSYLSRLQKTEHDISKSSILQGDILMAENKIDDAIEVYKNAGKTDNSYLVITKLTQAYVQKGDVAKSSEILTRWIQEHPGDFNAKTLLAALYQETNNTENAIEIFESILKERPNAIIALNNLAWLYIDKNPSRALQLARKAFDQLPDRAEIADTLGWILVKQGKHEEGLIHLQAARSKFPESPDIRYHQAMGLILSGNTKRAYEELAGLLQEHKSFPSRKEAETLFNSLQ